LQYRVEPLGLQHDREAFCCGNDAIDAFCQQAYRDHAQFRKRIYVACESDAHIVIGYYALVMTQITSGRAKKHTDPAVQIEMVGVTKTYQARGVGKLLVAHALHQVYVVAQTVGAIWVWLRAADRKVADFYIQLGFHWLDEKQLKLYLPIEDIISLIDSER